MTAGTLAGHSGAWRVFGTGPRRLFALHCSLAHAGAWSGLAAALGPGRVTLTAMDLPGHGNSGPVADPSRFDIQIAAMASALLERMDGPVPLIGHSIGGAAALRIALSRPDLVERLVLVEPVLFGFLEDAGHAGLADHQRLEAPFWAALHAGDDEAAATIFVNDWGAGANWDQMPERQRRYITERIRVIEAGKASLYDNTAERIRLADVGALEMPVMLMEGAGSPAGVGQVLDCIRSVLPSADRVTVPGAQHMVPITHPQDVAGALAPFLNL